MNLKAVPLLLAVVMAAPAVAEQSCNDKVNASAPESRFKDAGKGVVTDTQTGQAWLRCPLGMDWNGSSCEGTSTSYAWNRAQDAVADLNEARAGGRNNWRLPSQDELLAIVEKKCYAPAINLAVFPYSPETGFWTSTEDQGLIHPRAKVVHFRNGKPYIGNKAQAWRVRPVADK